MPNSRSAAKRMRQNRRRADRNRAARSRLRTAVKKVRQAESAEVADAAFRDAAALLDRAASRRLIHPNKAARTKSRLSRVVHEKEAAASA